MFLIFVRIYRISLFFLECPPRILVGFMWRLQRSRQLVIVRLIMDEAKVWAYASHTQFFQLFPEFLHSPPLVDDLATGRDTFMM